MKGKIKDTLFELIKIKSVESNPEGLREVANYVLNRLENAPLVKKWEYGNKPSVFVSLNGRLETKVVFVGHLDVVEGDREQFNSRIEDEDKVFGRGALDMKGPDAVMIELAEDFIKDKDSLDVGFLFTTDEEVGSENGVARIIGNGIISAEFAVIPDGGKDFNLVIAGKGVLHFKLKCHGRSTHGSRVWEGENAIEKCIAIYERIKRSGLFPEEPCGMEDHWHNTINLGKICGGDSVNRVPDYAEMLIDTRFVPPFTVEEFKNKLREFIPAEVEFEVISYGEPVETPKDNPFLIKMKESVRETLKRDVKFIKEHGATDARFFAKKGIDSVILYPIGGNIHGKNEWVSLKSLEDLFIIFKKFIKKTLK